MLPLQWHCSWSLCLTTEAQRSRPLPATPEHWQWHMGCCQRSRHAICQWRYFWRLGASVSALAGSDGRVEPTEHIATTGAFTDRTRDRTSYHSVSIVVITQYASERVAVTGHRSSHPKGVLCVCTSRLCPRRHPPQRRPHVWAYLDLDTSDNSASWHL